MRSPQSRWMRRAIRLETERRLAARRIHRDCGERIGQLIRLDSLRELDRADVMLVEALGEPSQDGILGIGRDPFDDQLLPRDAERERCPRIEKNSEVVGEIVHGRTEEWVAGGVDGVLPECNGEIDEEIAQVTG